MSDSLLNIYSNDDGVSELVCNKTGQDFKYERQDYCLNITDLNGRWTRVAIRALSQGTWPDGKEGPSLNTY